jgi:histone H3/H4
MNSEDHFLPKMKIMELVSQISQERMEKEVVSGIQAFSEKFLSDILNRTCLISRHRGNDMVLPEDILFTVEKEFDYSFGSREICDAGRVPTSEHIERIAEIHRQK